MRRWTGLLCIWLLSALGCARTAPSAPGHVAAALTSGPGPTGTPAGPAMAALGGRTAKGDWLGFDRNDFPGDSAMANLRRAFAFTGYWLNNPPGEHANTWTGKRALLREQGWGFLVLANGRLDAEILKAQKTGTRAADLGRKDATAAVARAQAEGFPANATLFLDQEEGGRLLDEQAAYLLGWTEAVAATGFRPGVYASGQQVEDGPGAKIDTVEDIRVRVNTEHLHQVAIFAALDQCPPAPGCTLHAKPLSTLPDADVVAWQYAQSPRRPEITRSCAATYAPDGNCYASGAPGIFLDMNTARSPDPSNGR